MSHLFLALQLFILITQIVTYSFSGLKDINFFIVNYSSLTVFFSFILSLHFRKSTCIQKNGFSVILFFVLMSWIICFQVPLEIVYGNTQLLSGDLKVIYDESVINKLVAFSSLALNFFLFGVTLTYIYSNRHKGGGGESEKINLDTKPLLVFIYFLFFMFIFTVNKEYVLGGHGSVKLNSLSASFIGLFAKVSILYLSIMIYNSNDKRVGLIGFLRKLNKFYILIVVILTIVFFTAHNRFYPIMILSPIMFLFFMTNKKQFTTVKVVVFFLGLSVFATLFKIYGFAQVFSHGFMINEGYNISLFYFPFTAELANSIYSHNILYYMWEQSSFSLYGVSFLVGLIRVIPGGMGLFGLEPILYDSALIATFFSSTAYGVGTTSIADLLVNFGLLPTFCIFFFIGCFFAYSEVNVYKNDPAIRDYVVYFSIVLLILFYPRGSFNDLISFVIFNLVFYRVYYSFVRGVRK